MFGGVHDDADNRRTNKVRSVYLGVPTLEDFCVKALIESKQYTKAQLSEFGLAEVGLGKKKERKEEEEEEEERKEKVFFSDGVYFSQFLVKKL